MINGVIPKLETVSEVPKDGSVPPLNLLSVEPNETGVPLTDTVQSPGHHLTNKSAPDLDIAPWKT